MEDSSRVTNKMRELKIKEVDRYASKRYFRFIIHDNPHIIERKYFGYCMALPELVGNDKDDEAEMAILSGNNKEDAYTGDHTTVWGSWWKDHQWGYKCCQQVVRNSHCTRTAGAEVVEPTTDLMEANAASHQKRTRTKANADAKTFLACQDIAFPPAEVVEDEKEISPCFFPCLSSPDFCHSSENSSCAREKMPDLKLKEMDKNLPPRNPHLPLYWEEDYYDRDSRFNGEDPNVNQKVLNSLKRRGVVYMAAPELFSKPPRDHDDKNDKAEMAIRRGKNKDDAYIGDHTTVRGSWWKDHQWGYRCCQQVVRNSHCTGAAGVEVVEPTTYLMEANAASHQKRRRTKANESFLARQEVALPPAEVVEDGKEINPRFFPCLASAAWCHCHGSEVLV